METTELKERIAQGENSTTEFKESFGSETIETVTAFANTDGGIILIGVSDKAKITGITLGKETIPNIVNRISQAIEPRVLVDVESLDFERKSVLLIHIMESPIKPVPVKGICYKRVGNSNRVMSPQQIAQMHLKSIGHSWDQLSGRGASIEEIDEQKIEWYLTRRESIRNVTRPPNMSTTDLLRNLKCISDEEATITHAGILFFSKFPQKFIHNGQLRVVRFKGTSVTHPVIDRLDCSGALWEIVNAAQEFIRKNIRLLSLRTSKSFQRDDKFEYPLDALREAIINALIHRNYQEHADVRVFIFDNRLEIINPGSFPEGISPDKPIHRPVNPILSQLMYDIGFIEKYGSGIMMMRRLCEEWENTEPRYELHPLETKVIFDSPIKDTTYIEIDDKSDQLNERQKNAFSYVQRHGEIANREYMEINQVSHRIAYEELKDMEDKGFVSMIGRGRGTKYIQKVTD